MDSITQESGRRKKKKAIDSFVPPQFTSYESQGTELPAETVPVESNSLGDEDSTALTSAQKRRLRKKQAIVKKQTLAAVKKSVEIVEAKQKEIEKSIVTNLDNNLKSTSNGIVVSAICHLDKPIVETQASTMTHNKIDSKSREQIKAEREAKKLAKQQKSKKASDPVEPQKSVAVPSKLKGTDETDFADSRKITDLNISDLKICNKEKSKAELKAERRALQESQRAAKEQAAAKATVAVKKEPTAVKPKDAIQKETAKKSPESKPVLEKLKVKMYQSEHKVKLFQHLYAEREAAMCAPPIPLNSKEIHPAIIKLGVQYASGTVVGSNSRCIALLNSLKEVVADFNVPAQAEFGRALDSRLSPGLAYLHRCRPIAVSMQNALKHFRYQLLQLPNDITESDAKIRLNESIDTYIREQIDVAGQAISLAVRNKISDGDVILTYSCSSLVEQILADAWAAGVRFRVIAVGARPGAEAAGLARRLAARGLRCALADVAALGRAMRGASLVLLGAGALLANGSVLGRAGTAAVALAASALNVPVLVCCQTHKFSERVQADALVHNEIGEPSTLVGGGPLAAWRASPGAGVQPLRLLYDVTPPDLVAAVVTELAVLPCTSVPVVLRFKLSEYGI